jgi:hypothetical protein
MDPELGMGIEFLTSTPDHRERLQGLILRVTAKPESVSEVLVEPEGMDWDYDAAQPAPPEEANPDPLLELFRTGAALNKAQFLVELEKHQLAATPAETGEPVLAPPFAYQRREPRIAVSLPVQVLPNDQLVHDLEDDLRLDDPHPDDLQLEDLRGGELQDGDTQAGEFQADVLLDPSAPAGVRPTTAHFIDVSHRGARIGGVAFHLKPGEVVNLVSDGVEARFLVIWVGERGTPQEGQIGLQSLTVS